MYAKNIAWIFDFEKLEDNGRVYWRIETTPTHYDAYHDRHARGEIILTSREVLAFIEGCWAVAKINPTTRAGDRLGPAARARGAR